MGTEEGDAGPLNPEPSPPPPARPPSASDRDEHPDLAAPADERLIQRVLAMRPMPDRPRPVRLELVIHTVRILSMALPVLVLSARAAGLISGLLFWALAALALLIARFAFSFGRNLITRRVRALLLATDGLACPACHHSLARLPARGQCPECATIYDHGAVRSLWRTWYPRAVPRR